MGNYKRWSLMSKIPLKYIGTHAPQEIIEVEDTQVEGLLATGGYVLVANNAEVITDLEAPKVKKKK